jgi:integrase
MTATRRLCRQPIAQLRDSPLALYVDAFEHLHERSYAPATHPKYISCLTHFARWMGEHQLSVEELDEDATARRADAIVRCAPGLRRGEIAGLSLDDIDWRAGTITLRRTKGRRDDCLPLPVSTGRAIAGYLRLERPQTTSRAVFMRRIAACDRPLGPHGVGKAMRQASARAVCPIPARTCCVTAWPAVCWRAAARSRRWPTSCVTARCGSTGDSILISSS